MTVNPDEPPRYSHEPAQVSIHVPPGNNMVYPEPLPEAYTHESTHEAVNDTARPSTAPLLPSYSQLSLREPPQYEPRIALYPKVCILLPEYPHTQIPGRTRTATTLPPRFKDAYFSETVPRVMMQDAPLEHVQNVRSMFATNIRAVNEFIYKVRWLRTWIVVTASVLYLVNLGCALYLLSMSRTVVSSMNALPLLLVLSGILIYYQVDNLTRIVMMHRGLLITLQQQVSKDGWSLNHFAGFASKRPESCDISIAIVFYPYQPGQPTTVQ